MTYTSSDLRPLFKWLGSNEAYSWLPYESWLSGGCLLLATALNRVLPSSEIWWVLDRDDRVQHAVLRYNDLFLDGDGVQSRAALLRKMEQEESVLEPSLVSSTGLTSDTSDIECPLDLVDELAKKLQSLLPSRGEKRAARRHQRVENWTSTAINVIRDEIMHSDLYQSAIRAVLDTAFAVVKDADVAELRKLGGFTAVLSAALDEVVAARPELTTNQGSAMIALSPADVLKQMLTSLREELQQRVVQHQAPRHAARQHRAGPNPSDFVEVSPRWVQGIRKWWKQQVRAALASSASAGGADSGPYVRALTTLRQDLTAFAQDFFLARGLWQPAEAKPSSTRGPSKSSDPIALGQQVKADLAETDEILASAIDYIQWLENNPPTTMDERDPAWREYSQSLGPYQLRYLRNAWVKRATESIEQADSLFSRRVLGMISRWLNATGFSNEVPLEHIRRPRERMVGEVKIIMQDIGALFPRHTLKGERDPISLDVIARIAQGVREDLYLKQLQHLWYGEVYVRAVNTGGDLKKGPLAGGDVGADYDYAKDAIRIFTSSYKDMHNLLVHELAHRHWFKYMTQEQRLGFSAWFGKVQPVTSYGQTDPEEEFAETFMKYVAGQDLTRDQIDRFKAFLRPVRKASQRVAKWERYDLVTEAIALNTAYWNRDLELTFPIVYRPIRRYFGEVKAILRPRDLGVEITELAISNLYDMDPEQLRGILAHELIHVALLQRGIAHDVGGSHGLYFRAEIRRLADLGLSVPLSDDVKEMKTDPGKPFSSPIFVAVIDGRSMVPFRRIDDQDTYDRFLRILSASGRRRLELFQTTNPVVRELPIAQSLKNVLYNKRYKLLPQVYDALRPDLVSTVDLTALATG